MKAACGAYMAPCRTSPMIRAASTIGVAPVSSMRKKAKPNSAMPAEPRKRIGRRPIRSDSQAKIGIMQTSTAAPARSAFSAMPRLKCTTSVM